MRKTDDLKWPLPSNLFSVMKIFHKHSLQGYVSQLSQVIMSPVIAVVKKDENVAHKALKDCKHDDLMIISDNWEEHQQNAFCRWMRKNVLQCDCKEPCECTTAKTIICDYMDKEAVLCLAKQTAKQKITEWEERTHVPSGTVFFRYKCKMGFIQWLEPIYVNDELQGAFITGQFVPSEYKENYQLLATKLEENLGGKYTAGEIKEALRNEDAGTLWKKEPDIGEKSENSTNEFFDQIKSFAEQIDELYKTAGEQLRASIQHQVLDIAWGRNSKYDSESETEKNNVSWDALTNRFTAIRTYLMDALIALRDIFELKELIVYKPRSDPNSQYNIKDVIQGADLTEESPKKRGDGLPISRNFKLADHSLLIAKINTESDVSHSSSELEYRMYDKPVKILDLLQPDKNADSGGSLPKDPKGAYMFLCLMEKDLDQSIAYYFKPQSKKDVEALIEILSSLSAVFLAQWNGVFAEYNRNIYETANKYLDHELGQALAGMDSALSKIYKSMQPALTTNQKRIAEAYPNLPPDIRRYLYDSELCYKNILNYKDLAISIVACSFINIKNRKLDVKKFYPYGRFLIRLRNIYDDDFRAEHKRLHMQEKEFTDYEHPLIEADPAILEQCVNNLIKNSLKYSHLFTNIEVTAGRVKDNPDNYEFIITNYGWPIPKDQEKEIFQLGRRGTGIENTEQTGIGFGLYIARFFARAQGGDVELIENSDICPLNVPLLQIYANSTHKQAESDIKEQCKHYLEKLQNEYENDISVYDQIVSKDPYTFIDKDHPFSPLTYIRRIDMPTARIRFRLWIPIKMRGNEK